MEKSAPLKLEKPSNTPLKKQFKVMRKKERGVNDEPRMRDVLKSVPKQPVGELKEVKQMLVDSSNPITMVLKSESLPMQNLQHAVDMLLYSSFLYYLSTILHHKGHMGSKRQVNMLPTKDFKWLNELYEISHDL